MTKPNTIDQAQRLAKLQFANAFLHCDAGKTPNDYLLDIENASYDHIRRTVEWCNNDDDTPEGASIDMVLDLFIKMVEKYREGLPVTATVETTWDDDHDSFDDLDFRGDLVG